MKQNKAKSNIYRAFVFVAFIVAFWGLKAPFASASTQYFAPTFPISPPITYVYEVCISAPNGLTNGGTQQWQYNVDLTQHSGASGLRFNTFSSVDPTCENGLKVDVTSGLSTYYGYKGYVTFTEVSTGNTYWTDFTFNNPVGIATNTNTPPIDLPIVYETCDVADLFCYIKNAFKWAFTVPSTTFSKFTELKDSLKNKAPFGYITAIYNLFANLNNTTTPAFTLQAVTPITSLVFTPIRTALVWLLYLIFAFMLFKRFKDIQI